MEPDQNAKPAENYKLPDEWYNRDVIDLFSTVIEARVDEARAKSAFLDIKFPEGIGSKPQMIGNSYIWQIGYTYPATKSSSVIHIELDRKTGEFQINFDKKTSEVTDVLNTIETILLEKDKKSEEPTDKQNQK
ncbi:MAG: hypothetical protein Q8O89_04415 [Nanoarchaeota archaeon]|nr:hypothetical protein [Nanoarchaeota archaeon]